jgi:hypothetical protein
VVDYSQPKPIDPIRHQPNGKLRIECRCGRIVICLLREFARERGLDETMLIYEMIARLRCRVCGERPRFAEVTRRPRSFGHAYWGTGRSERALWPRPRDY